MELTKRTLAVLQNFSSINKEMRFLPGNELTIGSPMRTIVARAVVDMEFPCEFAIYDLRRFLNAMALMTKPDMEFSTTHITIKEGGTQINYACADPADIDRPDAIYKLPSPIVQFTFTNEICRSLLKGLAVIGVKDFAIVGKGGALSLQSIDTDNRKKDVFSIGIGECTQDFNIIISKDNLRVMPIDYAVSVSHKNGLGIAHFAAVDGSIDYWLSINRKSKYAVQEVQAA